MAGGGEDSDFDGVSSGAGVVSSFFGASGSLDSDEDGDSFSASAARASAPDKSSPSSAVIAMTALTGTPLAPSST